MSKTQRLKHKESVVVKEIQQLYNLLSPDAKDFVFWSMVNTKESYKKKPHWSPEDNMILRVFFGKIHPDEMCEFFKCSYSSFMDQCQALGILDLSEGRQLNEEDLELFQRLLKSHSAKEVCEDIFGISYDKQYDLFMVSKDKSVELNKLKEQVGLEGFFDED